MLLNFKSLIHFTLLRDEYTLKNIASFLDIGKNLSTFEIKLNNFPQFPKFILIDS